MFKFIKKRYQQVKTVFQKTGSFLGSKIRALLSGKVDEEAIEKLEELFYEADLGPTLSAELADQVRRYHRKHPSAESEAVIEEIKKELLQRIDSIPPIEKKSGSPHVILIIGVNGNGKTTSVAKLGKRLEKEGKHVLVAAADTFRAAAVEQLDLWAKRANLDIVKGKLGSDPAAVVFDAIEAAKARGKDVVIVDTAGRLHSKTDLLRELEKIRRVSDKACPGAPHETLLVLDATVGQNGVEQALTFNQHTPLTGLVLTKLDGTAKGGTAISLQQKLKLPIEYIGIGEGIDDFKPFDASSFIEALLAE